MDRFDDRTPLWDYSDNSSPDTGASPGRYNRGRAEDASRAYVAIEEDEREQRRPRRAYREQEYRRDNWEDERAGDYRRPVRRAERSDWPRYDRTPRRDAYYDAAGEARGEDRRAAVTTGRASSAISRSRAIRLTANIRGRAAPIMTRTNAASSTAPATKCFPGSAIATRAVAGSSIIAAAVPKAISAPTNASART